MAVLPVWGAGEWALAALAAFCIGVGKAGFPGVGLVSVVVLAWLFPPRESTGVLLPLLICGDLCAVLAFRAHAQWAPIRRMLLPVGAGVVLGAALMSRPGGDWGPVIGAVVGAMALLHAARRLSPGWWERAPHTPAFGWVVGIFGGLATMLANAAGPVMALHFLAAGLPKLVLVGTSAWFFLLVNLGKVPFSVALGLIDGGSLALNALLAPFVPLGIAVGRWAVTRVPQAVFEWLLLGFATVSALRLLRVF